MEGNRLSIELRQSAVGLGLCMEWQREWKDETDKQTLIDKYFEGLDFPMRFHWPSNKFIKENFEQELLRKNNILVDDTRSLLNPKEAVILGSSVAKIRVNGLSHSVVYLRDDSEVNLYIRNKAFVVVHLFEQAKINIRTYDTPNVLVLKHSEFVSVEASEGVKIKNDLDYLK